MLEEGDEAPEFTTIDAEGNPIKLSDFRGQKVALYFYPRDNTPGCTREACSFRDSFAQFQREHIKVIGVSLDSAAAHNKFISKYELPFTLIVDPNKSISEAYGTYGQKKFMGKSFMGINRTTFLINEKGLITKIFRKVKPDGHAEEVLSAFNN